MPFAHNPDLLIEEEILKDCVYPKMKMDIWIIYKDLCSFSYNYFQLYLKLHIALLKIK